MAHLLDYENAEYDAEESPCKATKLGAARAAFAVHDNKSANQRRWFWAKLALRWAEEAGLEVGGVNLGHGRVPQVKQLRVLLEEEE